MTPEEAIDEIARMTPTCPYCGRKARKAGGRDVYPHRRDLWRKLIWLCDPCGAYVGVHEGTGAPLGELANAETRTARQRAHAAFDPLWKAKMQRDGCSKTKARSAGYKWLANQLGIRVEDCHIGRFDDAMCCRVVEICEKLKVK